LPLDKCVEYNGKIYCWNSATNKFCKVVMKDIKTENCPTEVIDKIITMLSETVEKRNKICPE
jgi:uncharacterized protein YuzB (UPF0349 family)